MTRENPEPTPGAARKHILLVEDHEDSADMMAILLENAGYSVRCVGTAAGALEVFAKGQVFSDANPRPDIILLDLTLPDLDGVELGRRLRSEVAEPPPIIVLSAKSAAAVASAAHDIAAAGYVRKPFSTQDLMASIARAMGSASSGARR